MQLIRKIAFTVVVATAAVSAQTTERLRALDEQLGRIFQSSDYTVPRFGPARWLPDGTAYAVVERSVRHDHQRHVGLGIRRGARRAGRAALESRQRAHRVLAVRLERRRHLP